MAQSDELDSFREAWRKEIKRAKLPKDDVDENAGSSYWDPRFMEDGKSCGFRSNLYVKDGSDSKLCEEGSKVGTLKPLPELEDSGMVTAIGFRSNASCPAFEIANSCLASHFRGDQSRDNEPRIPRFEATESKSKLYRNMVRGTLGRDFCFNENRYQDGFFSKEEKENFDGNFLDILIKDIDEVVGLPFFDVELPREIAVRIFSFLSLADLGRCAIVNSKWKQLSEIDLIWYQMCLKLKVRPDVCSVTDKVDWKWYLRDCLQKEGTLQLNWKERLCQVSDLEYERGGILCCASVTEKELVSGYKNGILKLWRLAQNDYAVELQDHLEPDVERSPVKKIAMDGNIIAAGYTDGKVNVWKCEQLDHTITELPDISCLSVSTGKVPTICVACDHQFQVHIKEEKGSWVTSFVKFVDEKILDVAVINKCFINSWKPHVMVLTKGRLALHSADCITMDYEYFESGAQLSCMHIDGDIIYCGISPFGYSILEGYMIRGYDISSGRMQFNISGPQCVIHCLSTSTVSLTGDVVVGCSDYRVRLHNTNREILPVSFTGLFGCPTAAQADDWKVVGGGANGTVCVWHRINRALLWSANLRHRTELLFFTKSLLVTVHIPSPKRTREDMIYADDLIEHRRNRGLIRMYDFTADTSSKGVHEFCKSDFDSVTGYNYNIKLAMPYDAI